jgi:hypothetical protein
MCNGKPLPTDRAARARKKKGSSQYEAGSSSRDMQHSIDHRRRLRYLITAGILLQIALSRSRGSSRPKNTPSHSHMVFAQIDRMRKAFNFFLRDASEVAYGLANYYAIELLYVVSYLLFICLVLLHNKLCCVPLSTCHSSAAACVAVRIAAPSLACCSQHNVTHRQSIPIFQLWPWQQHRTVNNLTLKL